MVKKIKNLDKNTISDSQEIEEKKAIDNHEKQETLVKMKKERKIKIQKTLFENPSKEEMEKIVDFSKQNQKEESNPSSIHLEDKVEENGKGSIAKKRGRKPKGGKIVLQIIPKTNFNESKPNIILHLKCSMKDIQNDLFNNHEVESFHFPIGKKDLNYEIIIKENDIIPSHFTAKEIEKNSYDDDSIGETMMNFSIKNNDLKQIWKKLKQLEYNLHINNISDKKSACFWCTYDFDNPPIYIPKHFIKDSYHVYGCFCSPECATAFLMEENIDSSAKFERYQLLNNIYSKIYDYKINIKPSPNPYYMLEKYYGNLSIQEYRSLLKNERLFLIVDKPLTRILPELHEDNDDFIINNKIIPSSNQPLKSKLRKKICGKNSIVNEKFGLS